MKLKSILVVLALVFNAMVLTGCKEKGQEQDVEAISQAEAKDQAEKEITEENLDDQLAELEEEIEADIKDVNL